MTVPVSRKEKALDVQPPSTDANQSCFTNRTIEAYLEISGHFTSDIVDFLTSILHPTF